MGKKRYYIVSYYCCACDCNNVGGYGYQLIKLNKGEPIDFDLMTKEISNKNKAKSTIISLSEISEIDYNFAKNN